MKLLLMEVSSEMSFITEAQNDCRRFTNVELDRKSFTYYAPSE
jgi:hypothetical protein